MMAYRLRRWIRNRVGILSRNECGLMRIQLLLLGMV